MDWARCRTATVWDLLTSFAGRRSFQFWLSTIVPKGNIASRAVSGSTMDYTVMLHAGEM